MKLLVCGGRDFIDAKKLHTVLDRLHKDRLRFNPPTQIIQGVAMGADLMARAWAIQHSYEILDYPADWKKHGRAAGPIRNQQMLDEGKPDLVVAFPGKTGTADMVRRAKAAGVEVIEVP